MNSITDGPVSKWRSVIELNLLGLSICTKEALQSMKERGVDDGHIIHIGRCSNLAIAITDKKFAIENHDKDCLFAATVIKECGWRLLFNQSVSRSVCLLAYHPVNRNINGSRAANFPSCLLQYPRTWRTTAYLGIQSNDVLSHKERCPGSH